MGNDAQERPNKDVWSELGLRPLTRDDLDNLILTPEDLERIRWTGEAPPPRPRKRRGRPRKTWILPPLPPRDRP